MGWVGFGSALGRHRRFFIGFCNVLEHPGDFTLVFVTFWSFGSALGQLWISFGSASGQAWQRLILAYVFHRFGALRPAFIGFCNVSEHPDDFSLENVTIDDPAATRPDPVRSIWIVLFETTIRTLNAKAVREKHKTPDKLRQYGQLVVLCMVACSVYEGI